jgi:hypothetical protein
VTDAAPPKKPPPPKPMGRPPPLPAQRPPAPSMTDREKQVLTFQALGLLNEQVQARIVHYKGDLETSPELDAITAEVVAQIKAMQSALGPAPASRAPPDEVEEQQGRTLGRLLTRLFAPEGNFATQNLKTIGRRIAKLFFESELHEKTKGDKDKVIHHAEQGVFYVLQRYRNRLRAEIEGFEYETPELRKSTLDLLAKIERDMQVQFLSRRSPELNRVMTIYSNVLMEFWQQHLPPRVEQMARITIRSAKTGHHGHSVAYKVLADQFPEFRTHWERIFMEQMVNYCGDELVGRLNASEEQFRDETTRFFTDPHIFSDTCEVVCDAIYDFLCLEGFLDLPVDWRVKLARN